MIIEKFFQYVCLLYQYYEIHDKFNYWVWSNADIFKVLIFNDDLSNINLFIRKFSGII